MPVFCMQVYFLAFLFWFSLSISCARVVQHKMWTDKARSMQTDKSTSHEHCTMHLVLWKTGTTWSWLKELLHVLPWPFQSGLPLNLSCPWIDLYHLYLYISSTCSSVRQTLGLLIVITAVRSRCGSSNIFSAARPQRSMEMTSGLCKAKIHKKINTEGNKVVCEKPQEFDDCHKTEEQILFSTILKYWWSNFPNDTFFMLLRYSRVSTSFTWCIL